MTELSPSAREIINAAVEAGGGYGQATPVLHARVAAVLKTVADQWKTEIQGGPTSEFTSGIRNCISALNEIAVELETHD